MFPEAVKRIVFSRHPGENRGPVIRKALKTMGSGFRRNDVKEN